MSPFRLHPLTHQSRAVITLLASLTFALCVRAAESTNRPVLSEAHVLNQPAQDPAWRELFSKLGKPENRYSRFEERRYFAFRDKPVVLPGEIRIHPERGLSLSYSGPKAHVLIIDEKGVLMRDQRGRERAAPDDSRARAATSALASILRFDLNALEKQFVVHGLREGDDWTLGFVPRDPSLTNTLGTIVVHGKAAALDKIEMLKSGEERIEILITDAQSDVIFPMDVLKRFFRQG
ncbi:MAG: outer membrane lipoprotein carrier protein LolA [Opitutus sp.]